MSRSRAGTRTSASGAGAAPHETRSTSALVSRRRATRVHRAAITTDANRRTPQRRRSSAEPQRAELARLRKAAALCARLGLECHAGHGLSYADVGPVAAIPEVRELNIGHFLVGEAIFVGLEQAIREMRRVMDVARAAGAAA